MGYHASSAALTSLKQQDDHAWLREVSCVPTQQALRHLQTAFRGFFEKRTGYPAFKRKHDKQTAEYTRSAFKWDALNRRLIIAQLGRLKIRWSRAFVSSPTTATITKDRAGRYFVSLVFDEQIESLPRTSEVVGIDLGISRLATLSTGGRISNPRPLQSKLRKLAQAQRVLSRRKRGSSRWERQRFKVARIHASIADARLDHLHKITTDLVRRFDVICVEDLNVREMLGNRYLSRGLFDASMGTFRAMLEYKCAWYGKEVRRVDRFFPSSKRCHVCGHILESLPLSVREWDCPECETHHDRDENAAKNILAAGHAESQNARGGRGRPKHVRTCRRSVHRAVNLSVERSLHRSSEIPVS